MQRIKQINIKLRNCLKCDKKNKSEISLILLLLHKSNNTWDFFCSLFLFYIGNTNYEKANALGLLCLYRS